MSKTLGVLGGMGPAATLDFLAKLQAATRSSASRTICACWSTSIPRSPTATPATLSRAPCWQPWPGACATAGRRCWPSPATPPTPMRRRSSPRASKALDQIAVAAGQAARAAGATQVGVLGTGLALSLYRDRFAHQGLEVVTLDDHEQVEFMALLYRIKKGALGQDSREAMAGLAHRLIGKGARAIVAGCTEAPLVLKAEDLTVPFIDATEVLARACVAACLAEDA